MLAESLLLKHRLIVLNRSRERAPNLRAADRVIAALLASFIDPRRLFRSAIVIKPSTILRFHHALVARKYRWLFTPKRGGRPGPKGPAPELIAAILEMERRNPRFGYQRIAEQVALVFDVELDKDIVRRVLAKHIGPSAAITALPGSRCSATLRTACGHSISFRCESLALRSHWVMVLLDQCTLRIVGFAIHACVPDGPAVCRMLATAIAGAKELPRRLSTDHDPLFEFRRWKANLRIQEIEPVKTLPYVQLDFAAVDTCARCDRANPARRYGTPRIRSTSAVSLFIAFVYAAISALCSCTRSRCHCMKSGAYHRTETRRAGTCPPEAAGTAANFASALRNSSSLNVP